MTLTELHGASASPVIHGVNSERWLQRPAISATFSEPKRVLATRASALTERPMEPDPAAETPIARQRLTFKFRLRDKHAAELNRQARAVNFVWGRI
jgi:hypothetical protein